MSASVYTLDEAAARLHNPRPNHRGMMMRKWIAVDEVGNDNFAISIYENEWKGLLVARCNALRKRVAELEGALKELEQCDLNDDNCASLEIASRRIRAHARAALGGPQ